MTIENPNTIDLVAVKPGTTLVRLVIADHLDWEDAHEHLLAVQEKVNAYLDFVQSGQLERVETPAVPTDPDVTIVLRCLHEPPEEARGTLEQMGAIVEGEGIGFVVEAGEG